MLNRILILGAAAVGAFAVTVASPTATPAHAEPCAPSVVPAPGCDAPAPPPPNSVGVPEGGPVCDLAAAFRQDPICGTAEVSGGM